MKKILLFIVVLTGLFQIHSYAQHVIISEFNLVTVSESYIELCNVGDTTEDLSNYILMAGYNGSGWRSADVNPRRSWPLTGKLEPGETWIATRDRHEVDEFGDTIHNVNPWLWAVKDSAIEYRAADVRGSDIFRTFGGKDAYGLAWKLPYDSIAYLYAGTDSMTIDSVNSIFAGDSIMVDAAGLPDVNTPVDVAGVPEATLYNIMIRKANIKKGEPDFNASRGGNPAESQWMVVPQWKGGGINRIPHNTLHIHGNYTDINFQSSSVTLDKGTGKAIMPYGIRKDSLLWHATMGPNTGYTYDIGVDTMNSTVFRTGDTLNMFVAGNELIKEQYIVEVNPPAADMNLAFPPLMYRNYEVTEKAPGMDTIFNVGFATRTDTLLKYVEVATNASVSFEWVDGVTRPDVKDGDIFRVTAENGDVKDYYIKVDDYVPNENVLLSQIYVNGDSIEVFAPTSYNYSVTLPAGTVNLPAIQPIPQDRRSKIVVTPPKLAGTSADRTATITVTAENDTLSQQYFITFNVAVERPDFEGDPFISQFIRATAVAIEIYNPSSSFVDLSNYIYFNIQNGSLLTYESIFTEAAIKENIHNYMRFGYYVDTTRHDGVFFLPTDKVDAFVEPGKTFGMLQDQPKWRDPSVYEKSQFISNRAEEYGFADMSGMHQNQYNPGHPQVLLKIINDSIIAGTKSATDPDDFELIDLIGEFGNTTNYMFGQDSVQWANAGRREMIVRLPHVYKGNPNSSFSPEGDFGLEDESTLEWDYQSYVNLGNNGKWVSFGYGEHFAEPVTINLSTVTSTVYSVSDGYIKEQTIKGVLPQTQKEVFYTNLIKANEGQTFKLMRDGVEKSATIEIMAGDKLIVTSADSSNTTTYVISVGKLGSDASLFSDVYSVDGLKIQGIVPGDLLSDVLANVYTSPGATIDVLDEKGQVIPTSLLNADTIMVDMLANDNMVLVVTAEDKNTQKTYSFQFSRASDDAWVMSSFYSVMQEQKIILGLLNGENVTNVLSNLIIPRDASVKIVDKLGNERLFGTVAFDDKVIVTSASKAVSATYLLSFEGEGTIVSVQEEIQPEVNLVVYPNPTSNYCIIKGAVGARNVVVRNLLGSVLYARNIENNLGQIKIEMNGYDNGIYLISVVNQDRSVHTLKVIKR